MQIILVLIFGLLLRLISINQSLWLDEATTAMVAGFSLTDFFTKFMPADFHPPLYYLIIHYWSFVFGTSEIAIRTPSVIFGLLTIYVTYLIAKQFKNDSKHKITWPIVPALFLATSGLHIYYSQEARMYSFATFLVTLIIYLFILKKWSWLSLSFVLLFLTDYLSMIIVPVLFAYQYLNNKKVLTKLVYSLIPVAVTFILWWPTLNSQLSAGFALKETSSAWWNALGPVTFKNVALIPTKFLIGRVSFENKLLYGIVMIIISTIFIYIIGKAKNKLAWYWFAGSLVVGILLSIYVPTLTYFRYLFILPAFYLLLSETKSKLFIAFVVLINLLSSYFYLTWTKFQRENWRELPNVIKNDIIVYPNYTQREALIYYGLNGQVILPNEIDTNIHKTVWLSRYVVNIADPTDSTRQKLEELGYNWNEEVNLNGVIFWKYIKQ